MVFAIWDGRNHSFTQRILRAVARNEFEIDKKLLKIDKLGITIPSSLFASISPDQYSPMVPLNQVSPQYSR